MSLIDDDGVLSEDLDEIVHDAASSLASRANNGGKDEQVRFLIETCGYSESDIRAAVEEKYKEQKQHE